MNISTDKIEEAIELINEKVNSKISDRLKRLITGKKKRQVIYEKFGQRAFLKPNELKYPVIDPSTGDYNCKLIYGAYIRSRQQGEKDVEEKAIKLFKQYTCNVVLNINMINEDGDPINMDPVLFAELFIINEDTKMKDIFYYLG